MHIMNNFKKLHFLYIKHAAQTHIILCLTIQFEYILNMVCVVSDNARREFEEREGERERKLRYVCR